MRFFFFILSLLLMQQAAAGLRDVDFDPHRGAQLPLNLAFRENGSEVRLDRYFGRAPVVLELGYLGCLNLCSTTIVGASEALSRTGLAPGKDYTALFVSIDPRDESARPERREGWHVLTGAASAAVLAQRAGFRYAYDRESGEFAHPAGFLIVTPDGRIAQYFGGVRFDAHALRDALLAADAGATPSALERVLLVCFHDPVTGKYSETVLHTLQVAGLAFLAALGLLAWRRL
jgi:protein SCO1/2